MQLWLVAAFASALFAGIVSILAKCGIKTIDSDVATALRTCVVAVFTWVMVAIAGSAGTIGDISPKSWLFLALSGLATGGSWICYFKALSIGDVNKVVPIDKSSTLMAVVLSIVLFNETSDLVLRLAGTGVATAGTFLMIERKASDASSASERDYRASIAYALAAAVLAALTSVLAKVGIEGVESNLATAIRTMFVLAMAWAIVAGKDKIGLVRGATDTSLRFWRHRAWLPARRGCATTTPYRWARSAWWFKSTSCLFWFRSPSPRSCSANGFHGAAQLAWRSSLRAPRLLRRAGEASMRLLGGFAGGIDPKGRGAPAFPQVGNTGFHRATSRC